MDDIEKMNLAKKIMKTILADVTDRRGWRQEWDMFEDDTRREIRTRWTQLIVDQLP